MRAFNVFFVLVIGAFAVLAETPAEKAPVEKSKRVAVMQFQNCTRSDALKPCAVTLSRLVANDLGATPGIQVLERERLTEAIAEIHLGENGFWDAKTAPKAVTALNSEFIIEGAFVTVEKNTVFNLSIYSVSQDKKVLEKQLPFHSDDMFDLESSIRKHILETIQPPNIPQTKNTKPQNIKLCLAQVENLTPDKKGNNFAEMLSDLIASKLGEYPRVTLITREYLTKLLNEQKLNLAGLTDSKNAVKAGKLAGADLFIYPTITISQGSVRIDLHALEIGTGKTYIYSDTGNMQNFATTVEKVFGEKFPYISYPSREHADIIDMIYKFGGNSLNATEFYVMAFHYYTDMINKASGEQNRSLARAEQIRDIERFLDYNIPSDILRMFDWLVDQDKRTSDERKFYINSFFMPYKYHDRYPLPFYVFQHERFKPLISKNLNKHIARCIKNNFPKDELIYTLERFNMLDVPEVIPAYLGYYEQTKNIIYLTYAQKYLAAHDATKVSITEKPSEKEIENFVKYAKGWDEKQQKQPAKTK